MRSLSGGGGGEEAFSLYSGAKRGSVHDHHRWGYSSRFVMASAVLLLSFGAAMSILWAFRASTRMLALQPSGEVIRMNIISANTVQRGANTALSALALVRSSQECMPCNRTFMCQNFKAQREYFRFGARRDKATAWHQMAQLHPNGKAFKYAHCSKTDEPWCMRCTAGEPESLEGWSCCAPVAISVSPGQTGSTSLAKYLDAHENVHIGLTKEHNFFAATRYQEMRSKREELIEYAHQFPRPPSTNDVIGIDVSPSYGCFETRPEIAKWIADAFDSMKIIFLRRDPVEKMFSTFRASVYRGVPGGAADTFHAWVSHFAGTNAKNAAIQGSAMESFYLGLSDRDKRVEMHGKISHKFASAISPPSPVPFSCVSKEQSRLCSVSSFTRNVLEACYFLNLRFWVEAFSLGRMIVVDSAEMRSAVGRSASIEDVYRRLGLDPSKYDRGVLKSTFHEGGHTPRAGDFESPKPLLKTRTILNERYFTFCESQLDRLLQKKSAQGGRM